MQHIALLTLILCIHFLCELVEMLKNDLQAFSKEKKVKNRMYSQFWKLLTVPGPLVLFKVSGKKEKQQSMLINSHEHSRIMI